MLAIFGNPVTILAASCCICSILFKSKIVQPSHSSHAILFNNEDVEFVVNHKHLGVTFSSDCKWHCHIQNILKSTSGQLSMLRKFKIKINRENLEKIYFTYIRPLVEYACELWV
jgi:hypothetical protein